jgi:hypothetical protein
MNHMSSVSKRLSGRYAFLRVRCGIRIDSSATPRRGRLRFQGTESLSELFVPPRNLQHPSQCYFQAD